MSVTNVKNSRNNNISYLKETLSKTSRTFCDALFWIIPHNNGPDEISLKIGRYNNSDFQNLDSSENEVEKSHGKEVTLKNDELDNLINFISKHYKPIQDGAKSYVVLDKDIDFQSLDKIKSIFSNPDKKQLIDIMSENDILPDDVLNGLQHKKKVEAVNQFKEMLLGDELEQKWQEWFQENHWVLGTEFVQVLTERQIDTKNTTDYLMQAYDGFLDIVEIKRPEGGLKFWAARQDHNNYVPSSDLIKAITQTSKYIHEVEKLSNDLKFSESVDGVKVIKPRGILIFGRSYDWNNNQKEEYRILNSCYHNVNILTYDHVLERAERMLGIIGKSNNELEDEIPF